MTDSGDRTIASYDARADAYLAAYREPSEDVLAWMRRFAGLLPPSAEVLELGSGPGTDAQLLEALGLRVQRSDASAAFADRLRGLGHDVLAIDVRRDPLPGSLDGVFANAVLLHLDRGEFTEALHRIRGALRSGGVLGCTLKEGQGEEWHERKLGLPRRFTYWRAAPLQVALETAGFTVCSIERLHGADDDWLLVLART